ncbi:hypothetical protein [Sulfuricurvum sp. RIFCSPLOWO2_12_FULL_43_24]|uniref:hypothetical protein n=2 Tax=Sulfuricurvum TaxID=286130 RepID=UPI000299837D|nr:hypothetical protein [Sulfuricurvum sp. RIFCSPLOWO2_12_FULL_43_24]AFV98345.1 hypothetical protein B649_10165 [Candidatus Sulfuricurvum sp. RIFRC-1]OHD79797.1 MAG: hypothetical protein A3D90_11755 [Sulfuricurvum sp. RIFCSPHIGHO2_02_FULL_43_9]OHD88608.1 MAG: hypothetical protein A3G19_06890 [Sulfuricurvum sp. RIFCSPLOWO2_12_FULL_43_24]HBM36534.1 hypothetical protein [Sulfuricurvum sp.]
MNMRKEIERLMYWYVPSIIVALLIEYILTGYIRASHDLSSIMLWSSIVINIVISHLHHIVVAIWLFIISKQLNQKNILWSLFGLVAHLFAAVIFLVLYVYEKNEMDSRSTLKGT